LNQDPYTKNTKATRSNIYRPISTQKNHQIKQRREPVVAVVSLAAWWRGVERGRVGE
jgi:hypothetical protein